MKTMLIALIILFSVSILAANAASKIVEYPEIREIDEDRMLETIAVLENSKGKTGKRGEYGTYQIHPATWKEHSSIPMVMVPEFLQRKVARNVLRHYAEIIHSKGKPINVETLAMAWCSGPYRINPSKTAINYARRAVFTYPYTAYAKRK